MSVEIWKDIPGYEGWYQISNLGRVKRLRKVHFNHGKKNIVEREHILKPMVDKKGYCVVAITCDGSNKKSIKVHRLVANAFIPNINNKPQVDHINRVRTDNRVENLRWVTNQENQSNSKSNRLLTYNGETLPMFVLCKRNNIQPGTVARRLKAGWSVEEALEKPVDTRFHRKSLRRD